MNNQKAQKTQAPVPIREIVTDSLSKLWELSLSLGITGTEFWGLVEETAPVGQHRRPKTRSRRQQKKSLPFDREAETQYLDSKMNRIAKTSNALGLTTEDILAMVDEIIEKDEAVAADGEGGGRI